MDPTTAISVSLPEELRPLFPRQAPRLHVLDPAGDGPEPRVVGVVHQPALWGASSCLEGRLLVNIKIHGLIYRL